MTKMAYATMFTSLQNDANKFKYLVHYSSRESPVVKVSNISWTLLIVFQEVSWFILEK